MIRSLRTLLKKPVFEKGNADWLSELPSVIRKYNNIIHHSNKMTPVQASKKAKETKVFDNLPFKREKLNPKFKLGQLIRTADIKRVFSKGDSTNFSLRIYPITEAIHDTNPSYRIDYLYNEREI